MAFKRKLFGNFGFLGDTGKQGKRLSFVSFRPTLQAILQTVPAKRRLQARCYQLRQQPPYVAKEGPAGHEAACAGRM